MSSWARKKKAPAASTPDKASPQPARAKRARRGSPAEQPCPAGGSRPFTRSAAAAELAGTASSDAADALAALSVAVTHAACTQVSDWRDLVRGIPFLMKRHAMRSSQSKCARQLDVLSVVHACKPVRRLG